MRIAWPLGWNDWVQKLSIESSINNKVRQKSTFNILSRYYIVILYKIMGSNVVLTNQGWVGGNKKMNPIDIWINLRVLI